MTRTGSRLPLSERVRADRVHHSLYTDPELFELEMQRIFRRAWVYVAHESQLPETGDFVQARLGSENVLVIRQADASIRVLINTCTHRGAQLCAQAQGNAARLVCPYHAWSFRIDGSLFAAPHARSYGAQWAERRSHLGLRRVARVESYRGFVFASADAEGPTLAQFLGPLRLALDNMADRAPLDRLEQAGGIFRQEYAGNWKLHLENANDLVHPPFVHQSSVNAARSCGSLQADATPQDVELWRANGQSLEQWDTVRVFGSPAGHSYMNGFYREGSIAPDHVDAVWERYREALAQARGAQRALQILSMDRYNNLIFPTLSINPRFQQLRIIEPITVARTRVTSMCFRLRGAPEELFHRAVRFLTVVNSPASLISGDDLAVFERCQRGLASAACEWSDVSRGAGEDQRLPDGLLQAPGTSELPMRSQLGAWLRYMSEEITDG